jgi:hypothetical protein
MTYVRDIAEREHQIPISIAINALAREFNCPERSVQSALEHGLELQRERGKHTALTTIVNNKFSTGFNTMPNKLHQWAKRRSEITIRAN